MSTAFLREELQKGALLESSSDSSVLSGLTQSLKCELGDYGRKSH